MVWLTAEKQKLLDQKLTLSALSEVSIIATCVDSLHQLGVCLAHVQDSSSADDQVVHLCAKLAQFTTRYNESSAKRTGASF